MPFSAYNYILPSELPTYIHKMASVTDETIAAKFISDAERIVDAYAGPAPRFYYPVTGTLKAAVLSGVTTLTATIFGSRRPNYWAKGGVYVEILDDAPAALLGQKRLVVGSDDELVTLASGFDGDLPLGASFEFRQHSAFPRIWDSNQQATPRLPDLLKEAVAYQVEYGFLIGSEEFGLGDPAVADGSDAQVVGRTYGSGYSEQRRQDAAARGTGLGYFIAPKAAAIMRRLTSAVGYAGY